MRILIAVDGSSCSEAAVQEMTARPFPTGSEMRVISVVEPPTPMPTYPPLESDIETLYKFAADSAKQAVERAVTTLKAGAESRNLRLTSTVLAGSPKRVIIEEAKRYKADLIVVGSHGYRAWERFLLGSVSQAVAAHAPCSVEIVRKKC